MLWFAITAAALSAQEPKQAPSPVEPVPTRVWKIQHDGPPRYVVVSIQELFMIPGGSSACVSVLDDSQLREIRPAVCFQTGWRIMPESHSLSYSVEVGMPVLKLDMMRVINGRDIAKEYFAVDLASGSVTLVRLEDAKGEVVRNEYWASNLMIGEDPQTSGTFCDQLRFQVCSRP